MAKSPKGGRPSSFDSKYIAEAERLCLLGHTDEELAKYFGVAASTLYDWKNRYPEFAEAIKRAKQPADATIATALFDRAKGAQWVEQQAIKCKRTIYDNGKKVSEEEYVEVVDVIRAAPPDTTACIFWLKNRRPESWRDRQEHTGANGGPIVMEPAQRQARVLQLLKSAKDRKSA